MGYREVCRAIIYNKNYDILLAKRSYGQGAGQWALVGGKPEADESPHKAIVREVKEELSLLFKPLLFKEEIDPSQDAQDMSWQVYYFSGQAIGQLALQDENTAVAYFSLDEMEKLDIAFGHLRLIKEFLKQQIKN